MRSLHTVFSTTALAIAGALIIAPVRGQDGWEWEPDEGYHKEEWYDPSDWFDDDSTIDYEYDWNDYQGYSDNGYYDWGYDYEYYDDDYNPYLYAGYPYSTWYSHGGYDPDLGLSGNEWYWDSEQDQWRRIYRQRDDQDQNQHNENQRSTNQRNANQRSTNQRNANQRNENQNGLQRHDQGQKQRTMTTVNGTLNGFSKVHLKGQRDQHTIARLKLDNGKSRLINIGPRADLEYLGLETGNKVTVHGCKGRIGGKSVLMATMVMTDGKTTTIEQPGKSKQQGKSNSVRTADNPTSEGSGKSTNSDWDDEQPGQGSQRSQRQDQTNMMSLRGQLESMRKMQLDTDDRREHLFVRIKLDDGERPLVNFGPNVTMSDLGLQRGERVFVRGKTRQVDGQQVLFARDVRVESEPIELDWSPAQRRTGSIER